MILLYLIFKNNKNIDVTKYIENDAKKYSNEFSKIGSNFSNVTSKYIKKGYTL